MSGNANSIKPEMMRELAATARLIATLIDFDQLIADGVLRKANGWYQVLKHSELPEHVRRKVSAIRTRGGACYFKFMSERGSKKLLKELERLGY